MADKEVGELWRAAKRMEWDNEWAHRVVDLIHKLVEEAARVYPTSKDAAIAAACRRFGIDPEKFAPKGDNEDG